MALYLYNGIWPGLYILKVPRGSGRWSRRGWSGLEGARLAGHCSILIIQYWLSYRWQNNNVEKNVWPFFVQLLNHQKISYIQFFLLRNDKKLNCTINKKKVPTILHICVTKIIARNCSIISWCIVWNLSPLM